MEYIDNDTICCLICKYFEPRSQFCRKNPPVPIMVPDETGQHMMSAFPKISCPTLDWCSQFKKMISSSNKNLLLD